MDNNALTIGNDLARFSRLWSLKGDWRDELLDTETFNTLLEAKILTERWLQRYSKIPPHTALGYKLPAPEARLPWPSETEASQGFKPALVLTQTLVPFLGQVNAL